MGKDEDKPNASLSSPPVELQEGAQGFVGLLQGIDLPNLIQMCAMNGISGRLRIQSDKEAGEVYFQKGEIVHSVCGGVVGFESFQTILSWKGGRVQLDPDVPPPEVSIEIPWHALLLGAMAKLDELRDREEFTPPPPEQKAYQASETLRIYHIYSEIRGWSEILNGFIFSQDERKVIRPAVVPSKFQQWAQIFEDLLQRSNALRLGDESPPLILSLVVEKRPWVVLSRERYLIALETRKGVDLRAIHRKLMDSLE
jgi:hypothetical protein